MFIYMIIFHVLIKVTYTKGNAGTAIFYNRHVRTDCWNDDEITKLRARKAFEELIPHVKPDEVDVKYIKNMLRYLRKSLNSVDDKTDYHTTTLLKEALADTIGAHLRSEMLPAVRFSFYAGYVPYRNARQLHELFDDIKIYLNTQGLGWNKPRRNCQKWSNLTVGKILIGAGAFFEPCSCLITKRDSNSCIHLPIPKVDNDRDPSAIALPFKSSGLVSLTAASSNNILLKYYTTASRCILSSSPQKCRHADFVSFNNELWHWMKRDVAPHLIDEKLYAAYGGVLRIAAAVQNYGKGLSRRNLFEYKDSGIKGWHPWQLLTQSYIYINSDWTPAIYVGLVLLTALSIYLLQIFYNYICGDLGGCSCKGASELSSSKNVSYANVDTHIPAMLPQQNAVYYTENKIPLSSTSKAKSASLGSIKTQKVYDLNENTEKVMAVIMSDDEDSVLESASSQSGTDDSREVPVMAASLKRPKSPPKLETSISELTVNKTTTRAESRLPTYSTSTGTRTVIDTSPEQATSDSTSSGTGSCSSSRFGRYTNSTSRKSRSSRDVAWARRIASKHRRSITKSSSRTELNFTSNTTATSHK